MAKSVVAAGALIMCLASFGQAATWNIETIDNSGFGKYSSLKVDTEGNAHLVYVVDDEKHSLKYAFWDHSAKRWFTMAIGDNASFTSLTLDSKQRPHVSWADYGTGSGCKLRYAYWDGNAWQRRPIPLDSDVIAYYTSIAVDAEDRPSISFYEYRGARGTDLSVRLRVVTFNGKYWEVATIDGENQSGKFNAIAMDSSGHAHVAYGNVGGLTAGMRYAYWNGTKWNREVLEGLRETNGLYVGYSANLTLDKDGNPHVCYMDNSRGSVRYAVRKGGQWRIEVVDRVSKPGYPDRNSVAVDEEGRPYVAYYDYGRGALKVAYKDGQRWLGQVVDDTGAGFTSSVQVSRGTVWISYGDEKGGGMKVARQDISTKGPDQNALAPVKGAPLGSKQ